MQWLKDEKIKHRFIGLAVLLSMAVVFIPAMVKKSNQRLDQNMNLALKVPPKPNFPTVNAVKPEKLFNTIKLAHVVLPEVVEGKKPVTVARAESLSGMTMANRSLIQKSPVLASTALTKNKQAPRVLASLKKDKLVPQVVAANKLPAMKKSIPSVAALKPEVFAVQLASFSQQENALSLIKTLHKKGFKASFDKQGDQFRVLVGHPSQLDQAKNLQKKLASETQLNGLIVKVG